MFESSLFLPAETLITNMLLPFFVMRMEASLRKMENPKNKIDIYP